MEFLKEYQILRLWESRTIYAFYMKRRPIQIHAALSWPIKKAEHIYERVKCKRKARLDLYPNGPGKKNVIIKQGLLSLPCFAK